MITNLRAYLDVLKRERLLVEVPAPVNPNLEAAEIHRRVIAEEGPALLFTKINGSPYPLVTNLFGSRRRIELAFGPRPENLMREVASLPQTLLPPSLSRIWNKRQLISSLLKVGFKRRRSGAVLENTQAPPRLTELPLLTTWAEDGGPFITLPLVYTEHPETKIPNLGMYRLQRFDDQTTGFHCQIGKGAGFHLAAAKKLRQKLPVNVFIGGPPALMLAAIAPLPENVPEMLLASLVQGQRLKLCQNPGGHLPIVSEAEFALVGEVDPNEFRPEGPFGDHYGYYSLKHDYPVFHCHRVFHRSKPIFTATVVGKPRQEDFYLGDYLQELLSPLFPLVMPTIIDLWSYGETGYHSLAAAVVRQRYKREAMVSAFRILGEGQLSLTKFLLALDRPMNLRDFSEVLEYVLARADFRTDLYIFSNLAMDTLDYTGPKVNEGSKGVLLGMGEPIRELPGEFFGGLPIGVRHAVPFCRGCLVVDGRSYAEAPNFGAELVQQPIFHKWPLIVLVDNAAEVAADPAKFLWTVFTRFEPAADILAQRQEIVRHHVAYTPPILIDARFKPHYPAELGCDDKTAKLVDSRWREYFSK